MQLGGYTNRVAWIDLTTGAVEYKPIADEDARKYIGARGLGVKYVYDNGPHGRCACLPTTCSAS